MPRDRRTLQYNTPSSGDCGNNSLSPVKSDNSISPLAKTEVEVKDGSKGISKAVSPKDMHPGLSRRLNITSDYESSDSPGSSDHGDNVTSTDDLAMSPPKSVQRKTKVPTSLQVQSTLVQLPLEEQHKVSIHVTFRIH